MGRVVSLLRYPLKSARGEQLPAAYVDVQGVRGDRAWACLDDEDGTVGSAKHPGRWAGLLQVVAQVDQQHRGAVAVQVRGQRAAAGSKQADALLSEHLRRPVRMTRSVPDRARLHRWLPEQQGLVPDWMVNAPGQEVVTEVSGARPGGRFVDFGAVHLLTTGALAELAQQLGRASVDAVRFRPNLVLDAPRDPLPGQELSIGDVVLRVVLPTPRCIVPALQDEAAVDHQLLSALARHHRIAVGDLGRAACFGVYAEVLRPGHLELDQVVE